jgi:protein PhnA
MDIQLGFIPETVAASLIRNIHLTGNADAIEGRTDKVKGLVLRTEFLKKA